MHNPSYLIKSRHDIFYFRYPVVTDKGKHRISLSLRTRCPNEALRYSKALKYHGYNLLRTMDTCSMKHSEVMALLKGYFKKALDKAKNRIDTEGCLPQKNIDNIKDALEQIEYLIQHDYDCIEEQWHDTPHQKNALFQDLQKVMQAMNVTFDIDSQEYQHLKSSYKHARKNHFQDVLEYNRNVYNYSLIKSPHSYNSNTSSDVITCSLDEIIDKYLSEIKGTITDRSLEAQKSSLEYLIEYFGGDKIVSDISSKEAQNIKETLQSTPSSRNKLSLTRGKPLQEQVKIAQESHLECISTTTTNKYLSYFSALLNWSERNNYASNNPFANVQIKQNKKAKQREMFKNEEIKIILNELEDNSLGLVKNKSQYWGTLEAVQHRM